MAGSAARQIEKESNPFASPQAEPERTELHNVERLEQLRNAMEFTPYALVYHLVLYPLLGITQSYVDEPLISEVLVNTVSFCILVICYVYHCWFGSRIYGWRGGILLAFLAAFPTVGILVTLMHVWRARKMLRDANWKVRWFTATRPQTDDAVV